MSRIAVLGAGSWGTALAQTLATAGNAVALWGRDARTLDEIGSRKTNTAYLPGVTLSDAIVPAGRLADAVAGSEAILLVLPAQTVAGFCGELGHHVPNGVPLVLCAKGIDAARGRLLSSIIAEALPANPPAVLSGPSFAADVVRGLPTAVTVAARAAPLALRLAHLLSTPALRCYSSTDLAGVELGGALKNVLAIAAGAAAGAGLGASAQAAIVTRGFVEMRRLGAAFGARPETMMGLSGLGDLMLSCASEKSRNFACGIALGRGEPAHSRPLAEGVHTAAIAARLAADHGVEAPIIDAVHLMLERRLTIGEAVRSLMARPLKPEDA